MLAVTEWIWHFQRLAEWVRAKAAVLAILGDSTAASYMPDVVQDAADSMGKFRPAFDNRRDDIEARLHDFQNGNNSSGRIRLSSVERRTRFFCRRLSNFRTGQYFHWPQHPRLNQRDMIFITRAFPSIQTQYGRNRMTRSSFKTGVILSEAERSEESSPK